MVRSTKNEGKKETIGIIQNSLHSEYYILYTHPVRKNSIALFLTQKDNLISFIDKQFNENRGDGMDVIISDRLYESMVIGNHDGMLLHL